MDLEFINTGNNTTSGIIYLRDHALYPGTACSVNGFIGQLSVQASDFSVLSIALVTLLTITRTTYLPDASTIRKTLICLSVWVVPLITACISTGLGAMSPVSGNWCWIESSRPDLRYGLTHGWRMAIILVTAGIYIFIWWYMNRHFRSVVSTMTGASSNSRSGGSWSSRRQGFKKMKGGRGQDADHQGTEDSTELSTLSKSRISRIGDDWELSAPEAAHVGDDDDVVGADEEEGGRKARSRRTDSICSISDHDDDADDKSHGIRITEAPGHYGERRPGTRKSVFDGLRTTDTTASEFPTRRRTREMEREIKRMLLLNAYPIMYVILWIPGLVNRFLEATGNKSNSRLLATLQASSQFVGLANALTYGFNKALRTKFKRWWSKVRGRK